MEFNNLPDELLVMVFDQSKDLNDLIKFSHVCSRWRNLIFDSSLPKITHIKVQTVDSDGKEQNPKFVLTTQPGLLEKVNFGVIFPNLKFLKIGLRSWADPCFCQVLTNLMSTANPLTGFSSELNCDYSSSCPIAMNGPAASKFWANLKCFSVFGCDSLLRNFFELRGFGKNLKTFGEANHHCNLDIFLEYATRMPNVEFLYVKNTFEENNHRALLSRCPNVKVLYFSFGVSTGISLDYLTIFPNIRKLSLDLTNCTFNLSTDGIVNRNLKELSIKFVDNIMQSPIELQQIITALLLKYPGTKLLKIFNTKDMTSTNLIEIIEMLPQLVSLRLADYTINIRETMDDLNNFLRAVNRKIQIKMLQLRPSQYCTHDEKVRKMVNDYVEVKRASRN